MINWLLGRRRAVDPSDEPLIYAIGDVHGRADLLDQLLRTVFEDASGQPSTLVMLGDYVDRGEENFEVVERLANGEFPASMTTVFLKGNHEAALLGFLERPEEGRGWIIHGGMETLLSYGVKPPRGTGDVQGWRDARDAFAAALPKSHLDWLNALNLHHIQGQYFFAHAGVDKASPPDAQEERVLLWTRHDFIKDSRRWPYTVVHGHTPSAEPVIAAGRIGVDTGAYATGRLTAVRLQGRDRAFMSARVGGR